jgi:transposase
VDYPVQYKKFKGGEIMNYVGIDIAKFKHDCFIMTDDGVIIKDTFTFDNTREGFKKLLNVLKPLNPIETRIGFESTGHYAINLKIFLQDNGYSFMELNPLIISRFRKATTLRRTKTDKIDAKMICTALVSMDYKPYPNKVYHIYSLKLLTRYRNKLVRNRSTCLIRLTTVLDHIFPEFKPFFNNKFGSTALFILNKYKTPEKISKLTLESYEEIRLVSKGSFSHIKYLKLIELAKNTIGSSNDILEFQLTSILKLYDDSDFLISLS